jgi:hypothetical protein
VGVSDHAGPRQHGPSQHPAQLRSYNQGSQISSALPGDVNLCNDFTIGPDRALYVSDTLGSRIFRVKPHAQEAELLIQDRTLDGIDGITFLDGVLYTNNAISNNLYRIPLPFRRSGRAGADLAQSADQGTRRHASRARQVVPGGKQERAIEHGDDLRRPGHRYDPAGRT